MSNSINQWHIFISGYTQNRQQSTGLQKCWLDAMHPVCKEGISHRDVPFGTCFFPVLPWNYDWYTLARFIQINSHKTVDCIGGSGESPLINIYAYSWGAGYGAIQLAQNLQKVANYDVQTMVLADPVYCSTNLLMRWRALFCSRFAFTRQFAPAISIPANTNNVFWSRQYNNWPRAHSLSTTPSSSSKTKIHPPHLETTLIHSEMDDSHWFQSKVKELTQSNA